MTLRAIFTGLLAGLLMVTGVLFATAVFATVDPQAEKSTPTEASQIFAAAVDTIQKHFARQQQAVPATLATALRESQEAITPTTSVAAVKLMIDSILTAQFGTKNLVLDKRDELYWLVLDQSNNPKGGGVSRPPLMFRQKGKRWFIRALLVKPAPLNSIRLGDEVAFIDDAPFDPMLALRSSGEPQTIKLKVKHTAWGAAAPVSLPLYSGKIANLLLNATHESRQVFELGRKKRIGYLHLRADVNSGFAEELKIAATQFGSSCDFWILDLRDSVSTSNNDLAPFWEKTAGGSKEQAAVPPAIVLVNGVTAGALEQLAVNLKVQHKAMIYGTPTAGSYGSYVPSFFADDNWLLLLPTKESTQAPPIQPDVVIQDPLIYADGNDPLLDKALRQ